MFKPIHSNVIESGRTAPTIAPAPAAATRGFPLPSSEVLDLRPADSDFRAEVIAGLALPRKSLPCKLFYDDAGSVLFDQICDQPEYYPTRTELQIMEASVDAMAAAIGPQATIVEYGSGNSRKTRLLLDQLSDARGYLPIDISRSALVDAASAIALRYPQLDVRAVHADYTKALPLVSVLNETGGRAVAYFPGSTIGNFEPAEALAFLKSMRSTCGPRSGLLIGVDLKKDPNILHAAYNDSAEVTASFNLNLLRRINREMNADFEIDHFRHYAFFNPDLGRMEMHLVSTRQQRVHLQSETIHFEQGESIHTENCHKFTLRSFQSIAADAGYGRVNVWTDPNDWFSVQYFASAD